MLLLWVPIAWQKAYIQIFLIRKAKLWYDMPIFLVEVAIL
jgi:hypothetical protein